MFAILNNAPNGSCFIIGWDNDSYLAPLKAVSVAGESCSAITDGEQLSCPLRAGGRPVGIVSRSCGTFAWGANLPDSCGEYTGAERESFSRLYGRDLYNSSRTGQPSRSWGGVWPASASMWFTAFAYGPPAVAKAARYEFWPIGPGFGQLRIPGGIQNDKHVSNPDR